MAFRSGLRWADMVSSETSSKSRVQLSAPDRAAASILQANEHSYAQSGRIADLENSQIGLNVQLKQSTLCDGLSSPNDDESKLPSSSPSLLLLSGDSPAPFSAFSHVAATARADTSSSSKVGFAGILDSAREDKSSLSSFSSRSGGQQQRRRSPIAVAVANLPSGVPSAAAAAAAVSPSSAVGRCLSSTMNTPSMGGAAGARLSSGGEVPGKGLGGLAAAGATMAAAAGAVAAEEAAHCHQHPQFVLTGDGEQQLQRKDREEGVGQLSLAPSSEQNGSAMATGEAAAATNRNDFSVEQKGGIFLAGGAKDGGMNIGSSSSTGDRGVLPPHRYSTEWEASRHHSHTLGTRRKAVLSSRAPRCLDLPAAGRGLTPAKRTLRHSSVLSDDDTDGNIDVAPAAAASSASPPLSNGDVKKPRSPAAPSDGSEGTSSKPRLSGGFEADGAAAMMKPSKRSRRSGGVAGQPPLALYPPSSSKADANAAATLLLSPAAAMSLPPTLLYSGPALLAAPGAEKRGKRRQQKGMKMAGLEAAPSSSSAASRRSKRGAALATVVADNSMMDVSSSTAGVLWQSPSGPLVALPGAEQFGLGGGKGGGAVSLGPLLLTSLSPATACASAPLVAAPTLPQDCKPVSKEEWEERAAARLKDISVGKASSSYRRYLRAVPKANRSAEDPVTPNPKERCSRATFQAQCHEWRKKLRRYDDIDCPNNADDDIFDDDDDDKKNNSNNNSSPLSSLSTMSSPPQALLSSNTPSPPTSSSPQERGHSATAAAAAAAESERTVAVAGTSEPSSGGMGGDLCEEEKLLIAQFNRQCEEAGF